MPIPHLRLPLTLLLERLQLCGSDAGLDAVLRFPRGPFEERGRAGFNGARGGNRGQIFGVALAQVDY